MSSHDRGNDRSNHPGAAADGGRRGALRDADGRAGQGQRGRQVASGRRDHEPTPDRQKPNGPLGQSLAGSFGLRPPPPQRPSSREPHRNSAESGERGAHRRHSADARRERDAWPEIPEWADPRDLAKDVLADLRGLSRQGADFVAGHLVAASELADTDPETAWRHAEAARSQGGRIAVVRETVGLVAYRTGHFPDVIAELRAARRMSGGPGLVAVMADTYRALGAPHRAVELAKSPEARNLDPAAAAELEIVVAGARAEMGQRPAALAGLKAAAHRVDGDAPFAHRLYYTYAAMLEESGQRVDALTWFVRAADTDRDSDTDAAERAAALAPSEQLGP